MKYLKNAPFLKEFRSNLRKRQTDAEKLMWFNLRRKKVNGLKFYRQYSIGKYIVDFYSPKIKLAIELDGGQHNDNHVKAKDTIRTEYLNTQGIKVVRFWDNDVLVNIEGIMEEIINIITPPNLPLS